MKTLLIFQKWAECAQNWQIYIQKWAECAQKRGHVTRKWADYAQKRLNITTFGQILPIFAWWNRNIIFLQEVLVGVNEIFHLLLNTISKTNKQILHDGRPISSSMRIRSKFDSFRHGMIPEARSSKLAHPFTSFRERLTFIQASLFSLNSNRSKWSKRGPIDEDWSI